MLDDLDLKANNVSAYCYYKKHGLRENDAVVALQKIKSGPIIILYECKVTLRFLGQFISSLKSKGVVFGKIDELEAVGKSVIWLSLDCCWGAGGEVSGM